MKKILLIVMMLVLIVSISGCIGLGEEPAIKSQEEASEAIGDIGSDIEEVTTDISDIDESLG